VDRLVSSLVLNVDSLAAYMYILPALDNDHSIVSEVVAVVVKLGRTYTCERC
jgi:hypothetical protein